MRYFAVSYITAALFDHDQTLVAVGEFFAATGTRDDDIFHARRKAIHLCDAGFDGEQHTFLNHGMVIAVRNGGS